MDVIQDKLLTTAEVADYLDVPLASVYKWVQEGTITPAFRVGRHLRWRASELEAWLESRRDNKADEAVEWS